MNIPIRSFRSLLSRSPRFRSRTRLTSPRRPLIPRDSILPTARCPLVLALAGTPLPVTGPLVVNVREVLTALSSTAAVGGVSSGAKVNAPRVPDRRRAPAVEVTAVAAGTGLLPVVADLVAVNCAGAGRVRGAFRCIVCAGLVEMVLMFTLNQNKSKFDAQRSLSCGTYTQLQCRRYPLEGT